jgi:hypothetical protein
MENQHVEWVNQLFLYISMAMFSSKVLVYRIGSIKIIPSGYLTYSYGKSPLSIGKSSIVYKWLIFHSYVKLPESICCTKWFTPRFFPRDEEKEQE